MEKKRLSPKAIRLLRKVAKHILAEPYRYDQGVYGGQSRNSPCGTAACIAGWCDVLNQKPRPPMSFLKEWTRKVSLWGTFYDNVPKRAAKALGIEAWELQEGLFSGQPEARWPQPFASRWNNSRTAYQRAQIAAERIEHFIATDGKE